MPSLLDDWIKFSRDSEPWNTKRGFMRKLVELILLMIPVVGAVLAILKATSSAAPLLLVALVVWLGPPIIFCGGFYFSQAFG